MSNVPAPQLPIVVAPMAGGPSTPKLVAAAIEAGGWGLLAAANKTLEGMVDDVNELRGLLKDTSLKAPLGINIFVPDSDVDDATREQLGEYRKLLEPKAAELGAELGHALWDDDDFPAKIAWLIANPVDVVTTTFGLLSAVQTQALQALGTTVGATITTPRAARQALDTGVDFLIVQGPEAGGHQSTFTTQEPHNEQPLTELFNAIRPHTDVPLWAAGGIATPDEVRQALSLGAQAAVVGTAFLFTKEAGTNPTHRAALLSDDFDDTTLTRAFSGRFARSLTNDFIRAHHDVAPAAYPNVHRMAAPMRKAASAAGDPQWTNLWSGSGWRRTRDAARASNLDLTDISAATLTRWLAAV